MSVTLSPTQHQVTVNPTTSVVTVTAPGPVGPQGGAGQITSTTATASNIAVDVNGNSQNPTVSVTSGGTTTQRTFAFAFGLPTGKSGVIQSVAVTGSDGIQVDSGSPITTATGTIALGVDASALRTHINVEDGATADQTNAEIRAAVEAATDSNVFTDADHTKLNGIAAGAQVTDATNVDAAGAVMNTDTTTASMSFVVDEDNMSSDSATKLATQQSIKAYVDASVIGLLEYQGGYNAATDTPNIEASPSSINKGDVYAVTHAGSFHSIDLEVGDVLLAEENNPNSQSKWTVVNKDLNAGSIKTSYESNSNTNAFTDALLTKLNSVESSADVTDTANVNSAGAFMHTDIPDSDTGFVKRTGSETYDIDTSTYDPEGTGVAMSIALG